MRALAFACLFSTLAAAQGDLLRDGVPRPVAFGAEEYLHVFRFRAQRTTEKVWLIVAGNDDLDLAVAEEPLDEDTVYDAALRVDSLRAVESLEVPQDTFAPAGLFTTRPVLHAHVCRVGSEPAEGEVLLWEDRPGRRLLPEGRRTTVRIPAGGAEERFVYVPRFATGLSLRAESAAGAPRIALVREGSRTEGRPRGGGSEIRLEAPLEPGVHRLEVRGPDDGAAAVALELGVEGDAELPALTFGGEDHELRGPAGRAELWLDEEYAIDAFFDVDWATHGVHLSVTAEGGDFDVHVFRFAPVAWDRRDAAFADWSGIEAKEMHLGGTAPLPTGRYFLRIECGEETLGTVTIVWLRNTKAAPRGEAPPVLPGAPVSIRFGAGQDRTVFALPGAARAGTHLQLMGSRVDASLSLLRADTGQLLRTVDSVRCDEYLQVGEDDLVLPPGTPLGVVVGRWLAADEATGGALHVHPDTRPFPPDGFLAPYDALGNDPWGRAMAATVALDMEDSSGSGVVVAPSGLVLTCQHVVAGEGPILVSFPYSLHGEARQCFVAEVVASDVALDLSLLRLTKDVFDRPLPEGLRLPFMPLGRAGSLRLGDPVRMLGYPELYSDTIHQLVTLSGIAAAFDKADGNLRWLVTDARAISGNSGGAVLDGESRLISIVTEGGDLGFTRPVERIPSAWLERIRGAGGKVD